MGDIAVDVFLETLNQLIMSSKVESIKKEKHQLESLEEEIKYMRGFLMVTEKKRNEYSKVMNLVRQIKDVVSEAENIVELFVVEAFKANHAPYLRQHEDCFPSVLQCVKKMFKTRQDHLSLDLKSVKKKIKTLTAGIKQIYDENMCDINGVAGKKLEHPFSKTEGGSSSSGGSNTFKVAEEKVVVGFKEEVETLMGKLLDNGEGGRLEIISIVGAAGGSKTTLAREVYDYPLMSHTFGIRAWVNVSQDYDKTMKRNLLIRILELASLENHGDDEKSSEDNLGEGTSPKTYGDDEKSCEDKLEEGTSPKKHGDDEKISEDKLGEDTSPKKLEDDGKSRENKLEEDTSQKKHEDEENQK